MGTPLQSIKGSRTKLKKKTIISLFLFYFPKTKEQGFLSSHLLVLIIPSLIYHTIQILYQLLPWYFYFTLNQSYSFYCIKNNYKFSSKTPPRTVFFFTKIMLCPPLSVLVQAWIYFLISRVEFSSTQEP